jgi:hypothetical protein
MHKLKIYAKTLLYNPVFPSFWDLLDTKQNPMSSFVWTCPPNVLKNKMSWIMYAVLAVANY